MELKCYNDIVTGLLETKSRHNYIRTDKVVCKRVLVRKSDIDTAVLEVELGMGIGEHNTTKRFIF